MIYKRKFSLFISSTYEDLKEERQALIGVALENSFIPVGMEQFHGAPAEQWIVITKFIDECDFYLIIVGGRYGSIDESVGISFTEKEYDYAKSKGMPVLVLIKNPSSITENKKDTGNDKYDKYELMKKLDAFRNKVKTDKNTVAFFDDLNELKYEAASTLRNALAYVDNSAGWVRYKDIADKLDKPVSDYEFRSPIIPADGKHKEIGKNGDVIGEGDYIGGKLIKGIEYDVLIHSTRGYITCKLDSPREPEYISESFEYERLESYGRGLTSRAFSTLENHIIADGMDQYYVVDFKVNGETEKIIFIRPLEEFLKEKDPKQFKFLREMINTKSSQDVLR